ncbi:MAG: DUF4142 domain-containing protein [Gemmatimonadales bacterium]|nr:DUF4142 domain-containing protein [Gemmatimonadales bacterium]
MRSATLSALALAALIGCSPGSNDRQQGGAAGESGMGDTMGAPLGDTASATGSNTPVTPAGILSQISTSNAAEITMSRPAAKKAQSPAVKQIANQLVKEHTQNQKELEALARQVDVDLTAAAGGSAPDSAEMAGLSGAEFDRAFVGKQIEAHQANISSVQNQFLPAAQNPQVRSYLQKTLTSLQGHLASLEKAQQRLGT